SRWLVAVVVVASWLRAHDATAECAPSPMLVVPGGGELPEHADIYVFIPSEHGNEGPSFIATEDHQPLYVSSVVVGRSDAWEVRRLHVDAPSAGVLTLMRPETRRSFGDRWIYRVVDGWRRDDASIISIEKHA